MENLIDDVKKYLGIKPYDNFTNIVAHDSFFLMSLIDKYGKENVTRAIKELR
jgi:hypothetical protein